MKQASESQGGAVAAFTFEELHARTSGMAGALRAEVFYSLPAVLQRDAWDSLAEWADHRSALDFSDWCRS